MKISPLVSLIIPTYNGKEMMIGFLESLSGVTYKNYEIIVVDNGSSDGTYEYVKKHYTYVKAVKIVKNSGFTGAMNVGIRHSKGEYIIMLNDDMISISSLWLNELVDVAASDKNIAMVGFATTDRGVDFERLGHVETSKLFVKYSPLDVPKKTMKILPRLVEVDNIQLGLIKKEIFKKFGLFDQKYFIYWSEIDLCYKTKMAGYKIVADTRAKILHYGSSTMNKTSYSKVYYSHRGKIRFILKNLNLLKKLTTLSATLSQFFGEIILYTVRGDFSISLAIINSLIWNIINFRDYI